MRIRVYGIVQGVGFRPFIARLAAARGYHGYVRNCGSYVEIYLHDVSDHEARSFSESIRKKKPDIAEIENIEIEPHSISDPGPFSIEKSSEGARLSAYPPDVALCDQCLDDLFNQDNKRYLYPFTNCTQCGARVSVIRDLPYDRDKTSMARFRMCDSCRGEYDDLEDRRYDAQTISCPNCGPAMSLYNENEELKERGTEALVKAAALIDQGWIVVVKSWGGMHIAANLDAAARMREWYRRGDKPFAVMFRNLRAIERYTKTNGHERKLLQSPARPIVLLEKKGEYADYLEPIAPSLPNIGAYLPYSAIHHLLFSNMEAEAFISTSANMPGKPMIIERENVVELGADAYLLHNREITMRIDDSLVRSNQGRAQYIRRSRGIVPKGIPVPGARSEVLALGAEINNTGALVRRDKLYLTQYIGDCGDVDVLDFLEEALRHLLLILKPRSVKYVARDLHPSYSSSLLAQDLAKELDAKVVKVQHHYAHALALMLEQGLERGIFLTLDGLGFGDDGTLWGGEVLYADPEGYERLGHLLPVPMIGGDMAAKDAARVLFAFGEMTGHEIGGYFKPKEIPVLRKAASKSVKSSSMGRVLDAISCALGVNRYRTYEGESAMKLESLLVSGRETDQTFEAPISRGKMSVVDTREIFSRLLSREYRGKGQKARAARGAVSALIRSLVKIACDAAEQRGVSSIGLSGGVAYNGYITRLFVEGVREEGFSPALHDLLPPGDGCISAGQAYYASRRT